MLSISLLSPILRLVKGYKYADKHGEVCPAQMPSRAWGRNDMIDESVQEARVFFIPFLFILSQVLLKYGAIRPTRAKALVLM